MFNRFRFIAAAASLSAVFAAMPLTAEAADGAPSVAVQTGDLNLATNAGRTVLQNRIALAVDKVCAPVQGRTPWEVKAYRACRATARANAEPQFEAMVASSGTKVAAQQHPLTVK